MAGSSIFDGKCTHVWLAEILTGVRACVWLQMESENVRGTRKDAAIQIMFGVLLECYAAIVFTLCLVTCYHKINA